MRMLTKEDLENIQILVRQEVRQEIRQEVEPLKSNIVVLKDDTTFLKRDIVALKDDMTSLKKDMKLVKRNLSKLTKTVDVMINHFDVDQVKLEKRVKRVENHLNLND